jgi:hypothetical protein
MTHDAYNMSVHNGFFQSEKHSNQRPSDETFFALDAGKAKTFPAIQLSPSRLHNFASSFQNRRLKQNPLPSNMP